MFKTQMEPGSKDGSVECAGLGLISTRCHICVEFVVGSRLAPRGFFSGFSLGFLWVFLSPQKPSNTPKIKDMKFA